jgi:hypothetical protein
MQESIQNIATEYRRITYWGHNQNHKMKTPYIISLADALIFLGSEPITCLQSKSFIIMRDIYLNDPLYNFIYATSDMDRAGHYIYRMNSDGVENLYFTIHGLKYFSIIYPSPKHSIIALYYIDLESKYLRFARDAENFLV